MNEGDKASQFFQEYGKQVPDEIWNDGGTKQGVYLMTPTGKYLGAHFAKHDVGDTIQLLKKGLKRWKKIARKKGYKPKSIPPLSRRDHTYSIDRQQGRVEAPDEGRLGGDAALVLQVHSRDLPSHDPAPKYSEYENAWNQNWFELSGNEVKDLVPNGNGVHQVPQHLVRAIGRSTFIDNVRGQTKEWSDGHVKKAKLVAKPDGKQNGATKIVYKGVFKADAGGRSVDLDLYGEALWDAQNQAFQRLAIVAAGIRTGATTFNFREGEGPSPIGFSVTLEGQYDQE